MAKKKAEVKKAEVKKAEVKKVKKVKKVKIDKNILPFIPYVVPSVFFM